MNILLEETNKTIIQTLSSFIPKKFMFNAKINQAICALFVTGITYVTTDTNLRNSALSIFDFTKIKNFICSGKQSKIILSKIIIDKIIKYIQKHPEVYNAPENYFNSRNKNKQITFDDLKFAISGKLCYSIDKENNPLLHFSNVDSVKKINEYINYICDEVDKYETKTCKDQIKLYRCCLIWFI